ncbi:aminoacyl-tRNA hydrolase [bacterium]|nr:aminoacyl-tRNA hydrolase [bacterium]
MFLLAGLGNPGKEYKFTRHNIGHIVIDHLIKKWGFSGKKKSFKSQFFSGKLNNDIQVYALKPETYMNCSGQAIQTCAHYYKCPPENIVVICDDFELPFGQIRLRKQGSAGTHNGLKSVIQELGTNTFIRLRVGIGPLPLHINVKDYVLQDFNKDERQNLSKVSEGASLCLEEIMTNSVDVAMNTFNNKNLLTR